MKASRAMLLACFAVICANSIADNVVGAPDPRSGSMARTNPFPSSSGTGVSNSKLDRNDEYSAALQDCQSLPASQKPTCIKETNKRFGQM